MGMDVFGKKPGAPEGAYFRATVWWWRPLADYICEVAPEITHKCQHWHSNDGDGLNALDSIKLADRLQTELDAGRTKSYARLYQYKHATKPKERCWVCEGTGTCKPTPLLGRDLLDDRDLLDLCAGPPVVIEFGAGDPNNGGVRCNVCDGSGYCEPPDHYPFSVETVQKFVTFLRASGGFEIW